jgi:hypothetical protein
MTTQVDSSDDGVGQSLQPQQPQQPHGYYYVPLTEDGPYATKLEQYFSDAAATATNVAMVAILHEDPATIPGPGLSTITGYVAGLLGYQIGFYVDNSEAINQNFSTLLDQLNNPNTWIVPEINTE